MNVGYRGCKSQKLFEDDPYVLPQIAAKHDDVFDYFEDEMGQFQHEFFEDGCICDDDDDEDGHDDDQLNGVLRHSPLVGHQGRHVEVLQLCMDRHSIQLLQLGSQMKYIQKRLNSITSLVKNYPKSSIAIATSVLCLSLLRKFHYKLVVHPDIGGRHNNQNQVGDRHPSQRGLQSSDVEVTSEGGLKLRGWYVKHPKAEQIIVYFHQNAGNIGTRLQYIHAFLQNSNSNILLVAYRGFSDSDGASKPNEREIMHDAVAIFKKGIELSQESKLPLFVLGRSLGGVAAIHVLSLPDFHLSAKGIILQNTFTSVYDVGSNIIPFILFPLKWLMWVVTFGSYRSITKMKDIRIPVLFIKGKRDELVPSRLMDQLENELHSRSREHFAFEVPNGTHNDTWEQGGKQYFSVINEFCNHCARI